MDITHFYPWFKLDGFNSFIILAIILFFVLTLLYSWRFMQGRPGLLRYYSYILLTAIASIGTALSNNLILLLVFWGFLGLTLYLLINIDGNNKAAAAAKKTFIIVGGTDALMLLGIGIIYYLAGDLQMDRIRLELNSGMAVFAYVCIAFACFAKAGAMPFHSWIPDCAESAPVPVVAFLPASLDKLLGIYLLAKISLALFAMNLATNMFLMIIGAFTIIAAVMMALVQHNMKRLLGYHAVSQVGYMVLGIGTGTPIGVAGGIFHMLNHAIYKSCLFFTSGNVERQANTCELDKLGGLSRAMPFTYISALIASLSISGVPPFNGFVSKWMVYQGLISQFEAGNPQPPLIKFIVILCLAAAMFGSGLTLASFMKLMHATYLGQPGNRMAAGQGNDVPWAMWLPCIILAALCVIFGVFAVQIPIKYFIIPAVGNLSFMGTWYAGVSTLLILIGLAMGFVCFKLRLRPVLRRDAAFTGGEPFTPEEKRVTGTEFYNTIKEWGILKSLYKKAEAGVFDLYEQGSNFVFGIGKFLQYLHNGVLPTYLVWTLLGMIALFWALSK